MSDISRKGEKLETRTNVPNGSRQNTEYELLMEMMMCVRIPRKSTNIMRSVLLVEKSSFAHITVGGGTGEAVR